MDNSNLIELNKLLWEDVDKSQEFFNGSHHLYHYTSVQGFESILKSKEIWLSHPHYMNDTAEVSYALDKFASLEMKKCNTFSKEGKQKEVGFFRKLLDELRKRLSNGLSLNIFIFCFTEHDSKDEYVTNNGVLSMWRGYTSNQGIAFGFDTGQIREVQNSPFVLAKVEYLSENQLNDRINNLLDCLCDFITGHQCDDIVDLDRIYSLCVDKIVVMSSLIKMKDLRKKMNGDSSMFQQEMPAEDIINAWGILW